MSGADLLTSPTALLLILLLISYAAGLIGALMGVGGGLFVVPALILLFGLSAHEAIAASLVSVVATSTGAATTRVSEGHVNLRLGMFLEPATALGGLAGAGISVTILAAHDNDLVLALIPVILLSALLVARGRPREANRARAPDPLAERLRLGGTYLDPATGEREDYQVQRTGVGLAFAGLAGLSSGLLGIGGGIFKVPAMNAFMNVPFRIASATSTLMIGVTASAGALVYLFSGDIALGVVAPVSIATLLGSVTATHTGRQWPRQRLRGIFSAVLVLAAALLSLRVLGVIG